jgi:hypothetical protein
MSRFPELGDAMETGCAKGRGGCSVLLQSSLLEEVRTAYGLGGPRDVTYL